MSVEVNNCSRLVRKGVVSFLLDWHIGLLSTFNYECCIS